MSQLTLYHFPICPFSRTLRICLKEKNQNFDLVNENVIEAAENFVEIAFV